MLLFNSAHCYMQNSRASYDILAVLLAYSCNKRLLETPNFGNISRLDFNVLYIGNALSLALH